MTAAAAGLGIVRIDDHVSDFPNQGVFSAENPALLNEAAGQAPAGKDDQNPLVGQLFFQKKEMCIRDR